jgi:hypothetical protein
MAMVPRRTRPRRRLPRGAPLTRRTTARKPREKSRAAAKQKAAAKVPARRFTPAEELANRSSPRWTTRNIDLGKFYTEDAVSVEPAGGTLTGLQALRSKLAGWLAGLRSSNWKARHVFVSKNAVCIEWEADLVMKDGRQIKFSEVAVHELRGEKIWRSATTTIRAR